MDKLNLNLNELFRFFFAGALGILWFGFTTWDYSTAYGLEIKDLGTAFLVALISGSVIYSIHRSLIYPILYKLTLITLCIFRMARWDWLLLIPYYPSKLEKDRDFARWKFNQNDKSIIKNLKEWGSQIHFLYCSSWAIILSTWMAKYCNWISESNHSISRIAIIVLLTASVIHHIRYMIYESNIDE